MERGKYGYRIREGLEEGVMDFRRTESLENRIAEIPKRIFLKNGLIIGGKTFIIKRDFFGRDDCPAYGPV